MALFSAMQLIYYAIVKTNAYLLITINTVGCVIELTYITIYLIHAPKKAKVRWKLTPLSLKLFVHAFVITIAIMPNYSSLICYADQHTEMDVPIECGVILHHPPR